MPTGEILNSQSLKISPAGRNDTKSINKSITFLLSGMPTGEILNSQSLKISPAGRNDTKSIT
jgi:hypothetical protein